MDISDPYNPLEVAHYDFHPGSSGVYAGNWGVFPYTQSGLVFSTSMSGEGLFVLSPHPAYFEHEVPGATEDLVSPVPIIVTVTEYADYPLDLSTMRVISGLNGVYTDTTLLPGTGAPNVFAGNLPNPGQPGKLTYYFTLQNQAGRIIRSPVGALDTSHSFYIGPFDLGQNYPNPFNLQTTIQFALPVTTHVTILVYDLLGREVVRLIDGFREPGYQQVVWNGRTGTGKAVPSGIYIARLVTPDYTKSIKMLLLK